MSILVAVGSTNPVKVKATQNAFQKIWPDKKFIVKGVQIDSGISNQPMSDQESIQGAKNRAAKALHELKADYGVGLEGGVNQIDEYWFDCGWVVVVDSKGIEGIGSTARIITPPKMMEMIHQGQELGNVVDYFFGTKNAKQSDGHFGLMTRNAITRTSGYTDGIIMALTRFLNPQLF